MAISTIKNFSRKTINVTLIFLLTLSMSLTLSLSEIKNKKKTNKKSQMAQAWDFLKNLTYVIFICFLCPIILQWSGPWEIRWEKQTNQR